MQQHDMVKIINRIWKTSAEILWNLGHSFRLKRLLFRLKIRRWWGTDPSTRSQAEIDIMGEQDKDTALFGVCKWTNEKVDAGVLETLARRSQIFHYSKIRLYLFARNGFTKGLTQASLD